MIAVALLTLAACEKNPSRQDVSNNAVSIDIAGAPEKTQPTEASGPMPTERPATSAADKPGFAGLWAVDAAACKSPPWRFTERDLTTKGEVYCSFKHVSAVAAGYDIVTVCAAEGDEVSETMRLRLRDAGKVMTVSSDQTYKPIDLIRCGD